jgi:hypothetical protein
MKIDQEKFDEIVLALLFHNSWREKIGKISIYRAWKSLDWDALDRLHEKELISNPKGKAKSIVLTEEGCVLAKELYEKHFAKNENP